MLVCAMQEYESILAGDKANTTVIDVCATNARPGRTAPLMRVQKDKVLSVRHQLAMSKYGISERLNVALDRLIEGLVTERE